MSHISFGLISDIHISSLGDHHDMLSGRSADFLRQIVVDLNQIDSLDFVLITGDLLDTASRDELELFQQVIQTLKKPYYAIPGNHDRSSTHQTEGLTRRQFARAFNPQIEARPAEPEAQVGYWSLPVHPEVQLIGLDSVKLDDWGGVIDVAQLEWLKNELSQQTDKLIILAVHHPLHQLVPIDVHPDWTNFVCDNGPDLLSLCDRFPQIKLVLTGHHHLSKVDRLNHRLHMANPSICIYPCAYRTLQLQKNNHGLWNLSWQTHNAADDGTIAEAEHRMLHGWQEIGFDPDFVEEMVTMARGRAEDRNGQAVLKP